MVVTARTRNAVVAFKRHMGSNPISSAKYFSIRTPKIGCSYLLFSLFVTSLILMCFCDIISKNKCGALLQNLLKEIMLHLTIYRNAVAKCRVMRGTNETELFFC